MHKIIARMYGTGSVNVSMIGFSHMARNTTETVYMFWKLKTKKNKLEVSNRHIPCYKWDPWTLDLPGLVEQLQSWLCKVSYTAYWGHIQAVGVPY